MPVAQITPRRREDLGKLIHAPVILGSIRPLSFFRTSSSELVQRPDPGHPEQPAQDRIRRERRIGEGLQPRRRRRQSGSIQQGALEYDLAMKCTGTMDDDPEPSLISYKG